MSWTSSLVQTVSLIGAVYVVTNFEYDFEYHDIIKGSILAILFYTATIACLVSTERDLLSVWSYLTGRPAKQTPGPDFSWIQCFVSWVFVLSIVGVIGWLLPYVVLSSVNRPEIDLVRDVFQYVADIIRPHSPTHQFQIIQKYSLMGLGYIGRSLSGTSFGRFYVSKITDILTMMSAEDSALTYSKSIIQSVSYYLFHWICWWGGWLLPLRPYSVAFGEYTLSACSSTIAEVLSCLDRRFVVVFSLIASPIGWLVSITSLKIIRKLVPIGSMYTTLALAVATHCFIFFGLEHIPGNNLTPQQFRAVQILCDVVVMFSGLLCNLRRSPKPLAQRNFKIVEDIDDCKSLVMTSKDSTSCQFDQDDSENQHEQTERQHRDVPTSLYTQNHCAQSYTDQIVNPTAAAATWQTESPTRSEVGYDLVLIPEILPHRQNPAAHSQYATAIAEDDTDREYYEDDSGRDDSARDDSGRDDSARDDSGRDDSARDDFARDDFAQDDFAQDDFEQDDSDDSSSDPGLIRRQSSDSLKPTSPTATSPQRGKQRAVAEQDSEDSMGCQPIEPLNSERRHISARFADKLPRLTTISLRSSSLQSLVRPGTVPGGQSRPSLPTAAKPKATFQFTPNVKRASTPSNTLLSSTPAGGTVSIQNLLAHKLAVAQTSNIETNRGNKGYLGARIIPTTVQSKLAQYENMRRSKRDSKKSRDILELSWPPDDVTQHTSLYTPISLPYVMRQDESSISKKSQRPSIKHVDEANRSSAALFEEDDVVDDINNWILIQMPSILPAFDKKAMDAQRDQIEQKLLTEDQKKQKAEDKERESRKRAAMSGTAAAAAQKDTYIPSTFSGLPEGRLGTIHIRQSGKCEFVMGDHVLDINTGSECNFAQDVGCYIAGNSEFFFLGRCLRRMTVTPDVTRMIKITRNTGGQ